MEETFLDSKANDMFSKFNNSDLKYLLNEIEKYYLEYRTNLGLPKNITFGVEIEYEKVSKRTADKFITKNYKNWISEKDDSLIIGGEIISPVMKDKKKYWKELREICEFLSKRKADTLHNAGGHIHVGACTLGDDLDSWKNFIKLYTVYEHILSRFFYGDKFTARKHILEFAEPVAPILYNRIDAFNSSSTIHSLKWKFPAMDKCQALNFCNVDFYKPTCNNKKNTIEFRGPNASSNHVIWQNNINTCTKMLNSSRNLDTDFLDYKLSNGNFTYDKMKYSEVNIEEALEFVDLIFDNDLDKVYFLRQYIKNYEENFKTNKAVMAKRFVK